MQVLHQIGLLMLCAAYIQGPLTKLANPAAARAEMARIGLRPPGLVAAAVVVFELAASAAVITGWHRAPAALALALFTLAASALALRSWTLPRGDLRRATTNGFFEHVGLAGAFLILALHSHEAAP